MINRRSVRSSAMLYLACAVPSRGPYLVGCCRDDLVIGEQDKAQLLIRIRIV